MIFLYRFRCHAFCMWCNNGIKSYHRTAQMDANNTPDNWLQYAVKIEPRINFLSN